MHDLVATESYRYQVACISYCVLDLLSCAAPTTPHFYNPSHRSHYCWLIKFSHWPIDCRFIKDTEDFQLIRTASVPRLSLFSNAPKTETYCHAQFCTHLGRQRAGILLSWRLSPAISAQSTTPHLKLLMRLPPLSAPALLVLFMCRCSP